MGLIISPLLRFHWVGAFRLLLETVAVAALLRLPLLTLLAGTPKKAQITHAALLLRDSFGLTNIHRCFLLTLCFACSTLAILHHSICFRLFLTVAAVRYRPLPLRCSNAAVSVRSAALLSLAGLRVAMAPFLRSESP